MATTSDSSFNVLHSSAPPMNWSEFTAILSGVHVLEAQRDALAQENSRLRDRLARQAAESEAHIVDLCRWHSRQAFVLQEKLFAVEAHNKMLLSQPRDSARQGAGGLSVSNIPGQQTLEDLEADSGFVGAELASPGTAEVDGGIPAAAHGGGSTSNPSSSAVEKAHREARAVVESELSAQRIQVMELRSKIIELQSEVSSRVSREEFHRLLAENLRLTTEVSHLKGQLLDLKMHMPLCPVVCRRSSSPSPLPPHIHPDCSGTSSGLMTSAVGLPTASPADHAKGTRGPLEAMVAESSAVRLMQQASQAAESRASRAQETSEVLHQAESSQLRAEVEFLRRQQQQRERSALFSVGAEAIGTASTVAVQNLPAAPGSLGS
eukprot:RCo035862